MANKAAAEHASSGQSTDYSRYNQFMEIVRNRITIRSFDPSYVVPREHYEMILEAARHSPSGADAQPWHFIVVTNPGTKNKIADYCVNEQNSRAKLKMKFPTPDYRGLRTAPGFIVVASDFRWVRAFPVLPDSDTSELARMYVANAERILLQSVAAATMAAHLAAAALGYNVWWVTLLGQEKAQNALKPILGVPEDLALLDIMCFGPPPPDKKPFKRWKKELNEIVNWERFDISHYMTLAQIDDWIKNKRHLVMYKPASDIRG